MTTLPTAPALFLCDSPAVLPAKILIVDDEPSVCQILRRWLQAAGHTCETAGNAHEGWRKLEEADTALLISDIKMPGKSGMQLLAEVKERFGDWVAVVMVTAFDDRATAIHALELGAYGYIAKPFERNEVLINVVNALERRRLVLSNRQYQRYLEEEIRERTVALRKREEEIALRLMSASQYRDDETGGHIRRIGLHAEALAQALGWSRQLQDDLRIAAPMHDIGKIGVPDAILLKPGRLTREEFEIMKKHTEFGAGMLQGSDVPMINIAKDIALCHHEWWDGHGYPLSLSGRAIPPVARLVAIADTYDALLHDRVYRPAFNEEEVLDIMTQEKDRHFDPEMFDAFLRCLPRLRQIRQQYKEREMLEIGRSVPHG